MSIKHTTTVDIGDLRTLSKPIHLMQYDKSLPEIEVHITKDGQEYTIPSGYSATIRWGKPDKHGCTATGTVSGSTVTFQVTEQMACVAGISKVTVEIVGSDSSQAGTAKFEVIVDSNPIGDNTIVSDSEIADIQKAIETATTKANEAQTSANNAKKYADEAKESASLVGQDVTQLKQDVRNLQASVNENTSDISSLNTKVNNNTSQITTLHNMLAVYWETLYPVGSIYISTSSTFNPQTAWGGTWVKTADGRCLIGANDKYPLGSTGGETEHTLTIDEMPRHSHSIKSASTEGDIDWVLKDHRCNQNLGDINWQWYGNAISYEGGGKKHNNMQPYLSVYIWERTA